MTTERAQLIDGDIVCLCGNEPYLDGFSTCLDNGTVVEPDQHGEWGGLLYICERCHRIIDQDTGIVSGVATDDIVAANNLWWAR